MCFATTNSSPSCTVPLPQTVPPAGRGYACQPKPLREVRLRVLVNFWALVHGLIGAVWSRVVMDPTGTVLQFEPPLG